VAAKRKASSKPAIAAAALLDAPLRESVAVPANGVAAGTAVRKRERASVEGGLIGLTADGILGWAWDPAQPTRSVTAVVTSGGDVLGTGVADLFDHDAVRHHIGPGIPGFLVKPTRAPQGRYPVALTLKDEAGAILGAPLLIDDPAKFEPFLLASDRGSYEGYVDQFRDGFLIGWAWSPVSPDRPVVVELYEGDDRIDRTVASLYRDDLAAAGKRQGHCGFRLELPVALLDDRVHSLKIKIANSGYELPGGAIAFGPLSASALLNEIVMLRAEVRRLADTIGRIASPQGDVQAGLIRTVSERVAALIEVQRETVERELDALRAVAFAAAPADFRSGGEPRDAVVNGDAEAGGAGTRVKRKAVSPS